MGAWRPAAPLWDLLNNIISTVNWCYIVIHFSERKIRDTIVHLVKIHFRVYPSVSLSVCHLHTVGFDSQFKPSFSIQFDLTLVTQLVTAGLVILALPNVKFILKFIVLNHQDHACVFCHLPIIPLSPDCVINVGMTIIYKLDESDTLIAIEITSTAWSAALSIWTVQKCCALMDIYWNIVV